MSARRKKDESVEEKSISRICPKKGILLDGSGMGVPMASGLSSDRSVKLNNNYR